jgi:transposase
MVNYGPGIIAIVANLSVRQYIPYARVVEVLEDLFRIHISEGTVANLLKRFAANCQGDYLTIQSRIKESPVIGADETSVKVDGGKWWMHTYQNDKYTFIGAHHSRGIEAQEQFFPGGFPGSTLVTDCLAMQLSTPAASHQICNPHLLRELKALRQAHPEENWPEGMTCLIKNALKRWEKGPTPKDVKEVDCRLTKLLNQNQANAPGKIPAFHT